MLPKQLGFLSVSFSVEAQDNNQTLPVDLQALRILGKTIALAIL